jgi:adenosylhomocysteine nucleosidase
VSRNTSSARSILVCFAVPEEAAPFRQSLHESNVECLVSGIGKAHAERRVRAALANRLPSLVLTCGFAGALDPALRVGDVLFDEDPECRLAAAPGMSDANPATFHSAERVVIFAAEKARLRQQTGASAVEMESGIIRRICREHHVPSATIRAISDRADEDLPLDFNRLVTAEGRIPLRGVMGALVSSPGALPGLLRLQRNARLAARRLADVLCGLLAFLRARGD